MALANLWSGVSTVRWRGRKKTSRRRCAALKSAVSMKFAASTACSNVRWVQPVQPLRSVQNPRQLIWQRLPVRRQSAQRNLENLDYGAHVEPRASQAQRLLTGAHCTSGGKAASAAFAPRHPRYGCQRCSTSQNADERTGADLEHRTYASRPHCENHRQYTWIAVTRYVAILDLSAPFGRANVLRGGEDKLDVIYVARDSRTTPAVYTLSSPTGGVFCAELTLLPTKTRVVLLQHPRERDNAIGTAWMASLCLPQTPSCTLACGGINNRRWRQRLAIRLRPRCCCTRR